MTTSTYTFTLENKKAYFYAVNRKCTEILIDMHSEWLNFGTSMAPTFNVRQHYESGGNGHWLGSPCPLAPDSSCPTTARARATPRGPALQRSLSILCNDEGGGRGGGGGGEGETRSQLCSYVSDWRLGRLVETGLV